MLYRIYIGIVYAMCSNMDMNNAYTFFLYILWICCYLHTYAFLLIFQIPLHFIYHIQFLPYLYIFFGELSIIFYGFPKLHYIISVIFKFSFKQALGQKHDKKFNIIHFYQLVLRAIPLLFLCPSFVPLQRFSETHFWGMDHTITSFLR